MSTKKYYVLVLFCLIHIVVFSQDGTVLSTLISEQDKIVRDPSKVTMKSGFTAGQGRYFKAYIGDGNFQLYSPSDLPTSSNSSVSLARPNQNYIITTTFRKAYSSDPASFNMKDATVDIQYFDGLGRPIQNVAAYSSPTGLDVISSVEYDNYGREYKHYLPFESSNSNGTFLQDIGQPLYYYYNRSEFSHWPSSDKNYKYSVTDYEHSPLNRVLEQGAPGNDWQPGTHAVKYEYQTNSTTFNHYEFTSSGVVSFQYQANTLSVLKTTDEDNNVVYEYKDFEGKVICKEAITDVGSEYTRYCYDDFGLLRCVVPPKASAPSTNPALHDLCYYYRYDERKRLVEKKLPDVDWVYMIYDTKDRLVLTQDGNQRNVTAIDGTLTPNYYWSYILYDNLNRPTETGKVFLSGLSFATIKNNVKTNINYVQNLSNLEPLVYTYYDDRSGNSDINGAQYNLNLESGVIVSGDLAASNKGRVVGKKVKVEKNASDTDVLDWITTVYHYNSLGRMVQEVSYSHINRKNVISYLYNFAGEVVVSRNRDHTVAQNYVDQINDYDHRGRLITTKMNINGGEEVTVSAMAYNALGQLKTKYIHSIAGSAFLQKTDYQYNIRGWLTAINDPALGGNDGDKFGMTLGYNNPSLTGSNHLYNGNISEMKWGANSNINYAYHFAYTRKNQLSGGQFEKPGFPVNAYTTSYGYDKNGNIEYLNRNDKMGHPIDNIYCNFPSNSNQIFYSVDISGAGGDPQNGDAEFLPDYPAPRSTPHTFLYDQNGNLIVEPNTDFIISYNFKNLPALIENGSSGSPYKIENCYNSEGRKVRKNLYRNGYKITTDYLGPYVYQTETGESSKNLEYILMPEGRVVNKGTNSAPVWEWQYNLTDHLGNVRVVLKGSNPNNAVVCQENHYYPFGMIMADIGSTYPDGNLENVTQPYLYNGKEYNPELELNWYDYGARFYDPALGRWTTPDPLVEDDVSWSPYNYVRNNPIAHNDPDGRFWNYFIGAAAGAVAEYAGQVVASSIRDGGFSVENLYKDIDLVDIGISTLEGALTSGGSVVKGFVKTGIVVGSEIARNAVDGTISEGVNTNGVGETAKNTAIGLSLGKIGDAAPAPKIKVVNAPTPKQAVNQARQEAKVTGTVVNREKRIATETKAKSNQTKAKGANEAAGKTLQNSAASGASETTKNLTDEKKR